MPLDSSNRVMTPEDAEAIRQEVTRIVTAEGLTWKQVADECGVPHGTVTPWKAGTYQGRVDRIAEKMQKWMQARSTRATVRAGAVTTPRFVETATAAAIMTLLGHAQHMPDFAVTTGVPGIGKTSAAEAYARAHPHVTLITGHPGLRSAHAVLEKLCRSLQLDTRGMDRQQAALVDKLRGISALVIVDEAQHLSTGALDQLRAIHDEAGCGLALLGNGLIFGQLQGKERDPEFAQLFSRVGMRLTNARDHRARLRADAEALLDAWAVEDPAVRKLLHAVARKPGALRSMAKTHRLAHLLANGQAEALDVNHVNAAWERLSETALSEEAA